MSRRTHKNFNASVLVGQKPLAIVSPVPGTTRDIVESCVNFAGFPIIISDTAGLRDSDDLIEREGVNRALEK